MNGLRSNPQLDTRFADAPLNHEIGAETLAHLTDINEDAFELKSRCPCNYV